MYPDRLYTYTAVLGKSAIVRKENGDWKHVVAVTELKDHNGITIGDGHAWINCPMSIFQMGYYERNRIKFNATTVQYRRRDGEKDYTLAIANKIERLAVV